MMKTSRVERTGIFKLKLHSEIEINADSEDVWAILSNFPMYKDWNPVIPTAAGAAETGAILNVCIHWPGMKPNDYKLKVLSARINHELRWLGHFLFPYLLDGDHSFLIEPVGAKHVRLIQFENFSGLLVPIFLPWLRNEILFGFEKLNNAIKHRVEADDLPIIGQL